MSRRDELAAVLSGHRWRSDGRCTCGWRPDQTIPQFPDPPRVPTIVQFEQHQADAVLAWLGEQLDDRDLSDAMVNGIRHAAGDIRQADESRNDRRGARALDVVREWFGVTE